MEPAPDLREIFAAYPAWTVNTRLVWSAVVEVAAREDLGRGSRGERWIVPILGGRFHGAPGFEGFYGKVCAGGADRQTLRADGIKELDALYEIQTHDGATITIHNQVVIDESVKPERYLMSNIRLTAPEGPHAWLNRRVFVGTVQSLQPARSAVLIRGYLVERS